MKTARTFEVTWTADPEHPREVVARSAGQARTLVLRDLREVGCTVGYPDLRVRSLGAPRTSERLWRVAAMRGRSELRGGTRVCVTGCGRGQVVDADDAANFVIAMDHGPIVHAHSGDVVAEEVKS